MKIIINGEKEYIKPQTINELVEIKKLDKNRLVIEHNGEIVKQEKWTEYKLTEGDKMELLSFVGGG